MSRRAIAAVLVFAALVLVVALQLPGRQPLPREPDVAQSQASQAPANTEIPAADAPPSSSEGPRKAVRRARGIVLDRTREVPLLKATVTRLHEGTKAAETFTDESGAFDLACEEGDTVEVRAKGFFVLQVPLRCEDALRFLLAPGVLIEGLVLTPDGTPAAEASVSCLEGIQIRPDAETIANGEGGFSLLCSDGALRVSARHSSGKPLWQELGTLGSGTTIPGVVLRLVRGRRLSGRVVTAEGEPNAAQVLVIADDEGGWKRPTLLRATALGTFETTIGASAYTIAAVADDGRTVKSSLAEGEADRSALELRLPAWGVLRGRMIGDATGATVMAFRDRGSLARDEPARIREQFSLLLTRGSYYRMARVDGQEFEFEGVEPGTYSLSARSEVAEGRATASTSSSAAIVITMEATAVLILHVKRQDGSPVSGGIETHWEQKKGGMRSTLLRNGEIKMPGLPPGPVELRVRPADGPIPAPTSVVLEAGSNEATWVLSGNFERVTGRVLDAETQQPVVGASVSPTETEWYGWTRQNGYEAKTDESGAFTLEVASGASVVYVWHEEYESRVAPVAEVETILVTRGKPSDQVRKPKEEFDRIVKELREKGELYEANRKD